MKYLKQYSIQFKNLIFPVFVFLTLIPGLYGASSRVTLKDGRILTGEIAAIESVAYNPESRNTHDNNVMEKIVVIDDQLRMTYIPKNRILNIEPDDLEAASEIFKFQQPIIHTDHQELLSIGSYKSTPFDEFGRRSLSLGGFTLIQGITEIAPGYVKVQGINKGIDMRISPHAFRRDFITSMIKKKIDPQSLPDRLRIYLFYTQAELFEEAATEIEEMIHDFQDQPDELKQLDTAYQMVKQLSATRLADELKLRRSAGQHNKVKNLLQTFSSEGVSADTVRSIKKLVQEYDAESAKETKIIDELTRLCKALTNPDQQKETENILEEIRRELNPNTTNRFAEFLLSLDDSELEDEQRLAIGISGWVAGNAGTDNRLEIALSMVRLRYKIRKYFLDTTQSGRKEILEQIREEEAAQIETSARIIQYMKPPKSTQAEDPAKRGFYQIEIPSFENGKIFQYLVQLPPEYDPNRKYPTIITLHGEMTTPDAQVDLWAGPWKKKTDSNGSPLLERYGQGTRFGYIVIAPKWSDNQTEFRGTAAETGAVLYTLRDAERRFSIDTDRVFLTGHSAGGDAVWDLGLSHPDLWAGIIPIEGKAVRYAQYLQKNSEFVSVYAVNGELDGGKVSLSKKVLDPGMNKSNPFDMTCVVFRGRGNESFSDELIRIFEWMSSRSRNFFPKEKRTLYSMRPWDNSFWMAEIEDFSPKDMLLPFDWNIDKLPAGYSKAKIDFMHLDGNKITIKSTAAKSGRIFLSPEIVNFDQRIEVEFNGKKISPSNGIIIPSLELMLEDVRTRADRLHPFQAFVESKSE